MDNNKTKIEALVVTLLAAASLFSLGAVAATMITPTYAVDAGGDDFCVSLNAKQVGDMCFSEEEEQAPPVTDRTQELAECLLLAPGSIRDCIEDAFG